MAATPTPSRFHLTSKRVNLGQGALFGALAFLCTVAYADGIAVNPVRLEMEPGQNTASISISNNASVTKVLQASVMQWRQVDGESIYEPAKDIIATPVMFRIPPKSKQLVRVGFVKAPLASAVEQSYRLYLTEVPEERAEENQVRFLLRLGIPLFIAPAKPQDSLDWTLDRQADGKLRLAANNRGNRHVRVQGIQLKDSTGIVAELVELNYLLPGTRQEWLLSPQRAVDRKSFLSVQAQTGRGMLEADLPGNRP